MISFYESSKEVGYSGVQVGAWVVQRAASFVRALIGSLLMFRVWDRQVVALWGLWV